MPLPARGRLSFIGNSSGLEQPQQAHMRVIVRRWPFWASTPGLRGQPGERHGACLRGTACGARLCGSHHLGSDVGERNLAPVSGYHLSKTIPIDELGSGGLSRARRDGITRFAARGVHGLQSTGAVSCHTPSPDACARVRVWFWADARAADSSAAAPRQSASEVSRSAWPGSPSWSASGAAATPSLSPQGRRCSVIQFFPRHGVP
jgi:hypothetical protein